MKENPGLLTLADTWLEYTFFILLTAVIRGTFPWMKWSLRYLDWAYDAHVYRQVIAFRLVSALKQVTPESVEAIQLWKLY